MTWIILALAFMGGVFLAACALLAFASLLDLESGPVDALVDEIIRED